MTIFTIFLVLVFVIIIPYIIYQTFINGWLDQLIQDFTGKNEDDPGQINPNS